jgi:pimeloyl-ACP methyl ester carboxylesterase
LETAEYLLPYYLQDTLFKIDPINAIPVTSEIPTLILTGEFDTSTPPETSEVLLDRFSNHYYFVINRGGHGVSTDECGEHLLMQFVNNPTVKPDDC